MIRTPIQPLYGLSCLLIAATAGSVEEGDKAPDFILPVLGEASSLSLAATHGRVRYVDFWASWCAPCRVSIPRIVELQEELGGERFEVIAITVDERVDDAVNFLERYPVNYRVLSDPEGVVAAAYDLRTMPMSFVLDADGVVTLTHEGFRPGDMQAIRAHIIALLDRNSEEHL